uniref:Uncharacterized protein n=1 Tax=Candidatus Kentrum sp. DK TaxID=2126562 RepID=A0A450S907_9GAMM|nr:MAG: hypothetical protein BECKDK2373B_GA0170837_102039 [Candidatus Kentron sp. DK]
MKHNPSFAVASVAYPCHGRESRKPRFSPISRIREREPRANVLHPGRNRFRRFESFVFSTRHGMIAQSFPNSGIQFYRYRISRSTRKSYRRSRSRRIMAMICNSSAAIDTSARMFESDPEPIPRVFPGFLSLEDKSRIKKIFLCESLRTLRLCGCNLFFFNRRDSQRKKEYLCAGIRRGNIHLGLPLRCTGTGF